MAETTLIPVEDQAALSGMLGIASELIRTEPAARRIRQFAESNLFSQAPTGFDDEALTHGMALLSQGAAQVAAAADDEAIAALQREWLRLFPGVGEPQVPSWSNFYLDTESRVLGRESLQVRKIYGRYGLQLAHQGSEPDDDLGLMLGFLSHLVELEGEGRDTRNDQAELLREHILPWICAWRYAGDKHAQSAYYRGAVEFIFGLIRAYAGSLGFIYKDKTRSFAMKGQKK